MQKPLALSAREIPSKSGICTLIAVEHVTRMRGCSSAHLMKCSDGSLQVVKFRNNPQHMLVLANEMLASRLAKHVSLAVPAVVIADVSDFLIRHSPDLSVQLAFYLKPFRGTSLRPLTRSNAAAAGTKLGRVRWNACDGQVDGER